MSSRFDNVVQNDYNMEFYTPREFVPNFEAWDGMLGQYQADKDAAGLIAEKAPQHLSVDRGAVQDYMAANSSAIDGVADLYANDEVSVARKAQADLIRQIRKDWMPGGKAHAIEQNYAAVGAYKKQLDDMVGKGKLTGQQRDWLLNDSLQKFGSTVDPSSGQFRNFSGRTPAENMDLYEYAFELADGWKSNKFPAGITKTPQGYYNVATKEFVSEQEVFDNIFNALANNPKAGAFLNQAADMGGFQDAARDNFITSQLTNAAMAAANKAGFEKIDNKFLRDWILEEGIKQRNRLALKKEEDLISFERQAAGLDTPLPWKGNLSGIKEFQKDQAASSLLRFQDLLKGTSIDPRYFDKVTPQDFMDGSWKNKIGLVNTSEEGALEAVGLTRGVLEEFQRAEKSAALKNALAQRQLQEASKLADQQLGTTSTQDFKAIEGILNSKLPNNIPIVKGYERFGEVGIDKEQLKQSIMDQSYTMKNNAVHILDDNQNIVARIPYNTPEGKSIRKTIKQIESQNSKALRNSRKRNRIVNDYLKENNESRVSPWVTTDMPIIDQDDSSKFRKGLENELNPRNLSPSLQIHIPGVKKGLPITDVIPGDAKLGGVKFATNGNILGERTWEVTYSVKNEDGTTKNVTGYVPVSQLTNRQTKEYLQLPEVKAAEALSTVKDYNLNEWTLPDLPSVTIERGKTSDRVRIGGKTFTLDDAQKVLKQEYDIQKLSNQLGLDRESTINYIKAQQGQ